jgi:hypothetical protein
VEAVRAAVNRVSLGEEAIKYPKTKERIKGASMPEWLLEGNVASGRGGKNAKSVMWPGLEMFVIFIRLIVCFSRW